MDARQDRVWIKEPARLINDQSYNYFLVALPCIVHILWDFAQKQLQQNQKLESKSKSCFLFRSVLAYLELKLSLLSKHLAHDFCLLQSVVCAQVD